MAGQGKEVFGLPLLSLSSCSLILQVNRVCLIEANEVNMMYMWLILSNAATKNSFLISFYNLHCLLNAGFAVYVLFRGKI